MKNDSIRFHLFSRFPFSAKRVLFCSRLQSHHFCIISTVLVWHKLSNILPSIHPVSRTMSAYFPAWKSRNFSFFLWTANGIRSSMSQVPLPFLTLVRHTLRRKKYVHNLLVFVQTCKILNWLKIFRYLFYNSSWN